MKDLRILFLVSVFGLTAFSTKAQGPIPNITDSRLDFTVAGLQDDSIRLSSLKGKVLLIDFWASWCTPCRYTNRDLVKLYKNYNSKGLDILSISVDDNKKSWKKAIAKDKMTWLQGNDTVDGIVSVKWRVDALPTTFLVDKNGDVVAINLEKDELEKKIKELLGI